MNAQDRVMSYEEFLEIRIAFEKDVEKLKKLYKENQFAFWKYPSVGKCSERQRMYLDWLAKLRANDPLGIWE